MVLICNNPQTEETEEKYSKYYNLFNGIKLSDFQKWAIKAIVDGDNVLVTAHTGSGKTLPAEFAIQHFTEHAEGRGEPRKKIIYASPIKALSNQKLYDMRRKFPNISFGILTGDCKDNPEADVLIMTTEILRNTLFNKRISKTEDGRNIPLSFEMDVENELAAVIFDEVHYVGDVERGSVWEQSILLLPPQVQLVMLSATIDKPESFAKWIEDEKCKQSEESHITVKKMYLAPTYERVVPLTHYMWVSNHKSAAKKARPDGYEQKIIKFSGKPIKIATSDGVFVENNYYKMYDLINYMKKKRVYVKRQFVLDSLVRYLKAQSMLPALCFVFSRKHVELAAKEIQFSLFETDSIVPSIIGKECQKILMSKLPNYKEYLNLPEYIELVALLEKGVAIHHAGIMSVLREMVEMLFEKGYIKLLFATETFAVGINMPTKTVIFSGLTKYNGVVMRQLYSHEYTQMSGRAGRRGIDDIGHVIHCNNLFDIPTCAEYKKILTGPPQSLTSKFKISYGLGLNVFASTSGEIDSSKLHEFVNKSLLSSDIQNEIRQYDTEDLRLTEELDIKSSQLKFCTTPFDKMQDYREKGKLISLSSNKTKKKLRRELSQIEDEYKTLTADLVRYDSVESVKQNILANLRSKIIANNYIRCEIAKLMEILTSEGFVESAEIGNKVTKLGAIAGQLQEVHPLALANIYRDTDGFSNFDAPEIASLFSCFTNISVSDELKSLVPSSHKKELNDITRNVIAYINKYQDMETKLKINTGTSCDFNYDLQKYIVDWCNCENEIQCKQIINTIKREKGIFLGEFIKAILKINNISAEFEKICEMIGDMKLLEKIKCIPSLTLKYVASNQSLYI